jgi:hypothetical protein
MPCIIPITIYLWRLQRVFAGGFVLENEPTGRGVLGYLRAFFGFGSHFLGAGLGWLVGLMLWNPTDRTPVQRGTYTGEF